MDCLLVAVNAKYIHSNPGVMCLKSYYEANSKALINVDIAEFTINQQLDLIIGDIYQRQPDIIGFSCYIWNISYVLEVVDCIKKIMPEVKIWAGGPEVSYRAERFLDEYKSFDGIICGEGEIIFTNLMNALSTGNSLENVSGICYRNGVGDVKYNEQKEVLDLSDVPFIYKDMDDFEHRIVYYESSRGCPFSCSYCLSSIDKRLRFRDVEQVKKELQFFLDNKVPQVKFVDRTFNCKKSHANAIWEYILEHDNGVTNFHFEVAADLIDDDELELLAGMRPGLIQLEIGIQSVNPQTIREIDRTMNLDRLSYVIKRIGEYGNINQHVDLIAGLPYENLDSFKHSFNYVYALRCEQLQLGFLKVLSGSKMYNKAEEYGISYTTMPPYEVLSTKWLSYADIMELKRVEEMVEEYYNSGQFVKSIGYLEQFFETPYELYKSLGDFYMSRFAKGEKHSRLARYELLMEFAAEMNITETDELGEWMTYDIYIRENAKKRPSFSKNPEEYKDKLKDLYRLYKPAGANVHIERFDIIHGHKETYVVFDYSGKGNDINARVYVCNMKND